MNLFTPSRIIVVGGARGMGRWFVERLCLPQGYPVAVCDIAPEALETLPESPRLSRHLIEYPEVGLVEGLPAMSGGEAVVVGTPLSAMEATIRAVLPRLPDNTFVFDIGSCKAAPVNALKAADPTGRLSIAGLHPLFGPLIRDPVGQMAILCADNRARPEHVAWLASWLSQAGIIVERATPEQHDAAVRETQLLTHMVLLSFAKALTLSGVRYAGLLPFRTPPFTNLASFAGHLLAGNPSLYASIQHQHGEEGRELRRRFLNAVQSLVQIFDGGALADGEAEIRRIGDEWTGAEVSECRSMTSRAIGAVNQFERRLYDLKRNRALCVLRRLDHPDRFHVGYVEAIGADWVRFVEVAKALPGGTVAVPLDDSTIRAYARNGIRFNKSRTVEIKKRVFEVLTDREAREWIDEHAPRKQFDLNVDSPVPFAAEVWESWVPRICPGVERSLFVNLFRSRSGPFRVLLRLYAPTHLDLPQTKATIETFASDLARGVNWGGTAVPDELEKDEPKGLSA
jgi:prephenate dehydrogenase